MKEFLLIILFFSLCSCDSRSDRIIVGTSADNPPYEFINNDNIVGMDIEIIKEIAKYLDKDIEIKNMDFAMLIPALLTNNVDLVIAGISPTDERRKNVDFSDIYLTSNVAVLFKKDAAINLANLKDKILGAQLGTTWSNIAKSMSTHVKELSNNLILLEELKIGRLDMLVLEESQAKIFVNKYDDLKYSVINQSSNFGIALKKGSELTKTINEAIKKLKKDGAIEKVKNRYNNA